MVLFLIHYIIPYTLLSPGPVIRTGPNELSFGSPTALRKIYTQGKGAPLKTGFYSEAIPFKEQHTFSMV
jgi:hypothetical protein